MNAPSLSRHRRPSQHCAPGTQASLLWQSLEQDAQVSLASQMLLPQALQVPQSASHDEQSSPASQALLPQVGPHGPQSCVHDEQSSPASQAPSPQVGPHGPQSAAHDEQSSPASQAPSPQMVAHSPQSAGQLAQVSPASQIASPQDGTGQVLQSCGQVSHSCVSPDWSQNPSPHGAWHSPQSATQVVQSSSTPAAVTLHSQMPSPQIAEHTPQSALQLLQSSPAPQVPSPQPAAQSCGQELKVSNPSQALFGQTGLI